MISAATTVQISWEIIAILQSSLANKISRGGEESSLFFLLSNSLLFFMRAFHWKGIKRPSSNFFLPQKIFSIDKVVTEFTSDTILESRKKSSHTLKNVAIRIERVHFVTNCYSTVTLRLMTPVRWESVEDNRPRICANGSKNRIKIFVVFFASSWDATIVRNISS